MTATTTTRLTCDVITRITAGFTVICGNQYDGSGTTDRVRGIAVAEGWSTAYAAGQVQDHCPQHAVVTPVTLTPDEATA